MPNVKFLDWSYKIQFNKYFKNKIAKITETTRIYYKDI